MAKSFHRIESGKKIAGVCLGLADYFDIDVTLVRVLFVVLALASGGVVAVAYVILWLVAPVTTHPTRGTQQPS
jgi:phage shock protein PspC (stress-responsive transcriptional regulator)